MLLFERLLQALRSEKNIIESQILECKANDYPSYRYMTGKYKGMCDAIEILKHTWKVDDDNKK